MPASHNLVLCMNPIHSRKLRRSRNNSQENRFLWSCQFKNRAPRDFCEERRRGLQASPRRSDAVSQCDARMKVWPLAFILMEIAIIFTVLLLSMHAGHKHAPKVRVLFHFQYQPGQDNQYEIHLDGQFVQRFTLHESDDPVEFFEDTTFEVEKGKHRFEIIHGDKTLTIEEEFMENCDYTVTNVLTKN